MPFVFLDFIFPPRCVRCHVYLEHGQAICAVCYRRIILHRTFFCGKCRARRYSSRALCHKDYPFLLAAAGVYEDPALKALIRSLKFHFVRDAAPPLGALLATYAARLHLHRYYELVLPIPLSKRRYRERGFNQAELIGQSFVGRSSLKLNTQILRRVKHALPQSGLKGNARRHANIAGSFSLLAGATIAGRNIILLDDVVTSGATMLEAALLLKQAGAKSILALALAKA